MKTTRALRRYRHLIAAGLLVVFLQWAIRPAEAHDGFVHGQMALAAYDTFVYYNTNQGEIDRLALTPPANASATEWKTFLHDMAATQPKFKQLSGGSEQLTRLTNQSIHDPESKDLTTRINEYNGKNPLNPKTIPDLNILELMAAATIPDDNIDDTHLQTKFGSAGLLNNVTKLIDEAIKVSVAVLIIPTVCVAEFFYDLFTGDDNDCITHSKNAAEKSPTPGDIANIIPGFGDYTDSNYSGLWHFINMSDDSLFVQNNYDDHQGMLYEAAGPNHVPGGVDRLIMLGADLVGRSVNPEKSDGVQHYQIPNPNDDFKDGDKYNGSAKRNEFTWEKYTVAHTPFSPVDNLALYGWQQFRDHGHNMAYLGYPLHALGDATVPMHVACTTSYGHRPFETAVSDLWYEKIEPTIPSNDRDVLEKAFHYRQEILQWRAQGHPGDIPIRHLVREVAKNTLAYSNTCRDKYVDWPFNDNASLLWHADNFSISSVPKDEIDKNHQAAEDLYLAPHIPNAAERLRPLLVDGIAAQVAFLMSALETNNVAQKANATTSSFTLVSEPSGTVPATTVKSVEMGEVLEPLAPKDFAPPTPAETVAKAEYARLAALVVLDKMSFPEYLYRSRRVTRRLHEAEVKGDNSGKGIVDTGPLPKGTVLPAGTPEFETRASRYLKTAFANMKIMVAPKCANQPMPTTPRLKEIGYNKSVNKFLFVVLPVAGTMQNCPLLYQFDMRLTERPFSSPLPPMSYKSFVFRDKDSTAPSPDGKAPLVFALSGLDIKDEDRAFVLKSAIFYRNIQWRVRAVNANGISSGWSNWAKQQKPLLNLP